MKTLQDFYGDLVHKYGWKHVAPMLEVIHAIETEIQKNGLTVWTSHEILRITPHVDRSKWFDGDLLSIVPDRSGVARVLYESKNDHNKVGSVDFLEKGGSFVPYHELVPTIVPYLERLAQKKSA